VKELGEKRGEDLIRKAIKAFAIDRGRSMRRKALALGLKPAITNLKEVNDLPAYTFYREEEGNTICPLADAWQEKGELGQALGLIYCNVNDPWKIKSFDEKAKWRYFLVIFKIYFYSNNLLCVDFTLIFKTFTQP